jgi:hypothetical protein
VLGNNTVHRGQVVSDNEELCRAIRDTYRLAMSMHHADGEAISECVAILIHHRPLLANADARRMVARMLAEEPTL